mgnify:CR=1 FL=1
MELFDLYDDERKFTGETIERGKPLPENRYHLVIHICIFNSDGKMLIQQRQSFKKSFPGKWDVSVGGSAVAGENSRQAAKWADRDEIYSLIDSGTFIPYYKSFIDMLFNYRTNRGNIVKE